MRPILVNIIAAVGLVWYGSLPLVSMADQAELLMHHTHQELKTTVEKIQSGLIFFKPTERLGHREVSVHKAERMGLSQAKVGDEVILVIDNNNLLIDLHSTDIPPAGHRSIAGRLTYADRLWEVIEITNAGGKQTFAVDESAGSRLAILKEGQIVHAELNEDNMVVDIHPIR
jgi:hypothetical protein